MTFAICWKLGTDHKKTYEGGGGGGGWQAKYKKKYSRKGKLNEKNHARQLTLKKNHAMA